MKHPISPARRRKLCAIARQVRRELRGNSLRLSFETRVALKRAVMIIKYDKARNR